MAKIKNIKNIKNIYLIIILIIFLGVIIYFGNVYKEDFYQNTNFDKVKTQLNNITSNVNTLLTTFNSITNNKLPLDSSTALSTLDFVLTSTKYGPTPPAESSNTFISIKLIENQITNLQSNCNEITSSLKDFITNRTIKQISNLSDSTTVTNLTLIDSMNEIINSINSINTKLEQIPDLDKNQT